MVGGATGSDPGESGEDDGGVRGSFGGVTGGEIGGVVGGATEQAEILEVLLAERLVVQQEAQ